MNERLTLVRDAIAQQGCDALLVSEPDNRRYLSGFTGSAGVLVIDQEHAFLATDFRYYEQVKMQSPDFTLVEITDSTEAALARLVGDLGLKRIAFESHVVTVQLFEAWRAAMSQVEWVPTRGTVEEARQTKDEGELGRIQEAVRIADGALVHVMDWLKPGTTEREVAWEIEVHMRTHGAEQLSFTTIVASGPNGAMAHAVTSDRAIQAGDPVVIDMGARYEGYCSDLTRSFCLGHASDEYRRIWDVVLRAQHAAEAAIVPAMPGAEADAVARNIIYGAGYEGKFGHGLGHGVGLAIHEKPRAGVTSQDVLQIGTVVTVEPGIYIPGWGGVRIEDMVVVTAEGCRVLTGAPKVPVVSRR
jgi:Xaa-Pro aminopeptidase